LTCTLTVSFCPPSHSFFQARNFTTLNNFLSPVTTHHHEHPRRHPPPFSFCSPHGTTHLTEKRILPCYRLGDNFSPLPLTLFYSTLMLLYLQDSPKPHLLLETMLTLRPSLFIYHTTLYPSPSQFQLLFSPPPPNIVPLSRFRNYSASPSDP